MGLNKKAVYFTIDAVLATGIIVLTIALASSFYIKEQKTDTIDYLSYDLVNALTKLKISEIDNEYVKELIENKNITRLNNSILEQLGEFWSEGEYLKANKLMQNITKSLIPEKYGIGLYINDELIYQKEKPITSSLISSRKLISGIAKERPRFGISSRAFLKSIESKKTNAFAYFGGFVGQGNLTRYLEFIPSDAEIDSSFIEFDAGTSFDLYINNNYCDSFIPSESNITADRWNISDCNNLFLAGIDNEVSINFTGPLNESFIAGGFVNVKYKTDELVSNMTQGIEYYYFPGIDGLINLYSSFDIPGNLNSIALYLHFYNNKTTYLNIGNETLFTSSGSSEDQIINISQINLSVTAETIPIRMGVGNINEYRNTTSGEPSDSILVTDVSGSMDECGEYGLVDMCQYECWVCFWIFCWWEDIECPYSGSCSGDQCNSCSSGITRNNQVVTSTECLKTKLELAKEADLQFVDTVLNLTGNKVGLVSYESSVDSTEAITDIKINLQNEINSYEPLGATCICCGINRAKDMLLSSSNKRFMVVMSDGQENRYCNDYNDYTGSYGGSIGAIDAGQNACNNNITVFAVGFGEDADQDTLKQVACDESYYYNASNSSQITEIYQAIGEQILVIANYSSQIITVEGQYKKSILYPDSYIKFNYTPLVEEANFGEIEIVLETDKFRNCSPTITIPNNTRVTKAKVLSYSGPHWTSKLYVDSSEVFNINNYGSDYTDIGDPFVLQIPPNLLNQGQHQIEIETADNPSNITGCSKNNSLVYTLLIKSSIDYGEPLTNASGCNWIIEINDGTNSTLKAPPDYSGSEQCFFTSSIISYNPEDAYQSAVFNILSQLDFDDDNRVDINFQENDLVIDYVVIRDVPSLWGPAIVEIRIWE